MNETLNEQIGRLEFELAAEFNELMIKLQLLEQRLADFRQGLAVTGVQSDLSDASFAEDARLIDALMERIAVTRRALSIARAVRHSLGHKKD